MKKVIFYFLLFLGCIENGRAQTYLDSFDYNFTSTATGAINCLLNINGPISGIVYGNGDGVPFSNVSKGLDNSIQIISNATLAGVANSGSQRSNGYSANPLLIDIYKSYTIVGYNNSCEPIRSTSNCPEQIIDLSKFKKVAVTAKASSPMRLRFELGYNFTQATSFSEQSIFEMNLTPKYQTFLFDYNGRFLYYDSTKNNVIRLKFNVGVFDDIGTGYTGTVNISRVMFGKAADTSYRSFPMITGQAFYDLNNNQIKDNGEKPVSFKRVNIQPNNKFTFTNVDGFFTYTADTIGNFQLSMDSLPYFFKPNINTLLGVSFNSIVTSNFAYKLSQSLKDIAITDAVGQFAARPGFNVTNNLQIKNVGTESISANLNFSFPSIYTVSGLSLCTCTSVATTTSCTYPLGTFEVGKQITLPISGTLSRYAVLGDTLKFNYSVIPIGVTDTDTTNNFSTITYVIRGSFDPNNKLATPYLDLNKRSTGQWMDYTLQFQNTGTDTAFTVVVVDTLPQELIPSTLQLSSTSHTCAFSQKDREIKFTFSNILLPDSNINEKGSHGFVKFKIKTKPNLPVNQTIRNRAAIYFDFNSPVLTDFAQTTFYIPPSRVTHWMDSENGSTSLIFANPIEGERFYLKSDKIEEIKLFNSTGKCVFEGKVGSEGGFVGNLPSGFYIIHLDNKREKIIISR